jgi:alcohol dehydrogenase class IV
LEDLEREFIWRDGERTIVFRAGAFDEAGEVLASHGWEDWELLTTPRALAAMPLDFASLAHAVHEVHGGPVDELAAGLVDHASGRSLVALGGGRVIDVAKAVAAVRGARVAAIPTTLSGAEITGVHRLPKGRTASRLVRPALVVADPGAMTSLDDAGLRASAMNSLAHGAEALYTPLANPVSTMAALRGAELLAEALDAPASKRDGAALALGSILCAYAVDSTLFAVHHIVCQTLVRTMGTPHAVTNAAILPRAMEMLRDRAPEAIGALAKALGTRPHTIGTRIDKLAGGRRHLGEVGGEVAKMKVTLDAIMERGDLAATPGGAPSRDEIQGLIESAW